MIYKTITNDYEFWEWIKQSDSYSNNFSLEGAKALQAYLEELSEDIGGNIEWDPIAWCVEYSEYDSVDDCVEQVFASESDWNIESLRENTNVIELDNGHIIIQDF